MNTENKLKPKLIWPDEIRKLMIEKSNFYIVPTIYQYGYYDGFQKAIEGCNVLPSELLKQRDEMRELLVNILKIENGDTIFPHSFLRDLKQKITKLLESTEVKP